MRVRDRRIIRLVSFLIVAAVGSVAAAPAYPALEAHALLDADVTVVHTGDHAAREAALEIDAILTEGGFRGVTVVEARGAEGFASAVLSARTAALVIAAHGTPDGIIVGDATIAWPALAELIAESRARTAYLAACHSASVRAIDGKSLVTTFDGLVDLRVAAAQVAADFVEGERAPLLEEFVPAFAAALERRGGIGRYVALMLVPERPLTTEPADCAEALNAWYGGDSAGDLPPRGECIFFLHENSTNCYADEETATEACRGLTRSDQEAFNADARPDGGGASQQSGVEDYVSTDFWQRIDEVFGMSYRVADNGLHFRFSPRIGKEPCVEVLTVKRFATGGSADLVERAVVELQRLAAKSRKTPVEVSTNGPDAGIKLCGSLSAWMPRYEDGDPVRFSARGNLEAVASTWWQQEIRVFYWRVVVGFDAGISYPFVLQFEGDARPCYYDGSARFAYRFAITGSIGVTGGPLKVFVYGYGGYGPMGFDYRVGPTWTKERRFEIACPDGTTPNPIPTPQSADSRSPALHRLVDAGLGEWHDVTPRVAPDGARVTDVASLLAVDAGSAEAAHLAASGALEGLGAPDGIPEGWRLVLDAAHPRLRAALGATGEPMPPHAFALAGGAALVPAGLPVSPALDGACREHRDAVGDAGIQFFLRVCGDVDLDSPDDLVEIGLSLDGSDRVRPYDEAAKATHAELTRAHAACEGVRAPMMTCDDVHDVSNGTFTAVDLDRARAVFDVLPLLDRPEAATWLVNPCDVRLAEAGGIGVDTIARQVDGVATPCLLFEDTGGIGVAADTVLEHQQTAAVILARLAATAPERFASAAGPLGSPPPDDDLPSLGACEALAEALGRDPAEHCGSGSS